MTKLPPLERGLQILELAASRPDGFNWKQACACLGSVSTATVAKVLKVLTERGYLIQVDAKYKSGSAINRLVPGVNARDLLLNHGPLLAKEFSDYINESCVVAVFDEDKFRFTGVQIIEGSMGYSPPGMVIYREMGHAMTQILHATEAPENVKCKLEAGKISFGYRGTVPGWEEYSSVLSAGRNNGIFLEYGWRRPHAHRMVIPVFTKELSLAGAFMCGYSNKDILLENVEENFACYLKVMSKISNYEDIFNAGIKK
ncbi:MAG: hypothetical protein KAS17_11335 [Victivallaceae bacterium]|nr:hypothetical protein [Victivallaceae bacterium]